MPKEKKTVLKASRKKLPSSTQVLMCVSDCKYEVVREAALARGWKLVEEDLESSSRKCHVYWVDVPTVVERTQQLHPWQRINHFPGMSNVARKGRLAQNLDRMRRSFPSEFSFYPRTWVLPVDWGGFKGEFDAQGKSSRTFIVKPDSGCQGKGIFLTQDLDRVDCMESQVAQIYVRKPLLIEGLKFDLRVYVLVTSVMPLRVYVFKDGLARFCTEEYLRPSSDNLGERCMHLTNYAVNKCSDNFVANEAADRDDCGSKRSLRWLLEWITKKHGGESARALWRKMCSACVKTLASILPTLHREYLQMFGPDKRVRCPANDGRLDEASTPRDGEPVPRSTTKEHLPDEEAGSGCSDVAARKRDTVGHPMKDGLPSESASRPRELDQTRPKQNCRQDAKQIPGALSPGDEAEPGEGAGSSPTEAREGSEYQDHHTRRVVEGSRCLEILGFDFMIDSALKPWLIEVNHLPSFATDSPLDKRIKSQVVGTTLSVFRAKANDKKSFDEASKRDAQQRLYRPVICAGMAKKEQERRREAEAVVTIIRRKVEAIYSRFAPQKLCKVAELLARYAGDEDRLLRLVRRKYVDTGSPPSGENGTRGREGGASAEIESLAPSHGSDRGGVDARCPLPATLELDRQHETQTMVGEAQEGSEHGGGDDLPQLKSPAGGDIGSTEGTHHSGSWSTGSKKAWGGAVRKWMKQRDRKDAAAALTPPRSPLPTWTKDVSPSQGHPEGSSIVDCGA